MASTPKARKARVDLAVAGQAQAQALEAALIELGLKPEVARLYERRRHHSENRLEELIHRLSSSDKLKAFPQLSVYTAGSYARGEASPFSDIDLFFVHDDVSGPPVDDPNLKGIRAIGDVIRQIEEGMEFPSPSNDGQFLQVIRLSEILAHLGGPEDDYRNNFTARMLLLLESRAVCNVSTYDLLMGQIIEAYLRDYEDHAKDFHPTFLVNDIIRFWKTLCLNYENKRNQADPSQKIKQKIKNFKLKFSRMATCFSTVSLLSSYNTIDKETLMEIASLSPVERLLRLSERVPAIKPTLVTALEHYAWFLDKTSMEAAKLIEYFSEKGNRVEAFQKAEVFGGLVFNVVKTSAEDRDTLRYLVV